MDVLTLTLVLILILFALLGSGIWIAVVLGMVGFVAMALEVAAPPGTVLATSFWSASKVWAAWAKPSV